MNILLLRNTVLIHHKVVYLEVIILLISEKV